MDEYKLDIDVAVDHERKMYQVKLFASARHGLDKIQLFNPETGEENKEYFVQFDGILVPKRLQQVLIELNRLAAKGYLVVGTGTMHPDVILPSNAERTLEIWK